MVGFGRVTLGHRWERSTALRAQCLQSDVLSEMAPRRREPGSESYWTAREQSVQKGSRTMTQLILENSDLRE